MNEVAVIVRFHGCAEPALLDEALFSLCLQGGVRVRPIIVLHNVATHAVAKLQKSLLSMPSDWAHPGKHEIVRVASKSIRRGELLNRGLSKVKSRYVAFLDYDDVMYHEAYSYLIDRLKTTKCAVTAGGCRISYSVRRTKGQYYTVAKQPFKPNHLTPFDFLHDNHLALHSLLIDTKRIAKRDLSFNPRVPVLEDYDFILRMLARYSVDLNGRQRNVCEYRARLDGSNTTPFHDLSLLDKNDDWRRGRKNIRRLKRKLAFGMSFAALAKSYPTCTPGE